MNNNRGWGLRSELWICFGMIFFFAIAVILINSIYTNMDDGSLLIKDKTVEETSKEENNKNDYSIINDTVNNKENVSKKEQTDDNNSSYNYVNLEDKIVVSGSKYVAKYLTNSAVGDTKVVTVVRLQTENLLDKLEIDKVLCSGYIKIEKGNEDFKYYPYLKCGDLYKTVGYSEEFDNTDL